MLEDTTQLIHDVSLIEFYETKYNTLTLITRDKIAQLPENHKKFACEERQGFFGGNSTNVVCITNFTITSIIKCVQNMLNIGNGKVALCGFCLIDIMDKNYVGLYDLYFHSCTVPLAQQLLTTFIEPFLLDPYVNIKYNKSDNAIMIRILDKVIRIFCSVYKNKWDILTSLPSILRHCYCPIDGYLATIPAFISLLASTILITPELTIEQMYNLQCSGITILCNSSRCNLYGNDSLYKKEFDYYAECSIHNFKGKRMGIAYSNFEGIIPEHLTAKDIRKIQFTIANSTNVYIRKNPKDYYGQDYETIVIGINNDRYVAFANCKSKFSLSNDIFQLLCYYWFNGEVNNAKKRLLSGDY